MSHISMWLSIVLQISPVWAGTPKHVVQHRQAAAAPQVGNHYEMASLWPAQSPHGLAQAQCHPAVALLAEERGVAPCLHS